MGIYIGQVFSRWTVLGTEGRKIPCRCSCGTERLVDRYGLLRGHTKSCGCLKTDPNPDRGKNRRKQQIEPGDRFTRWTVLDSTNWSAIHCRCDCGQERYIPASNLYGCGSRSCGCLHDEQAAINGRANRKHGLGGTPIYQCWKHVMYRCHRPGSTDYDRYGARGISLHPTWHDPAVFAAELEAEIGPFHKGMTLDRVNNDGNYEPGNIRWATRLAQARNRHSGQGTRRKDTPGSLSAVRRPRKKVTHEQLVDLLALIEQGLTQTAAAARFGISQPHVSRLVREARQA